MLAQPVGGDDGPVSKSFTEARINCPPLSSRQPGRTPSGGPCLRPGRPRCSFRLRRGGPRIARANHRKFSTSIRSSTEERSEEHTSELQSPCNLVCRLLLEKKKT